MRFPAFSPPRSLLFALVRSYVIQSLMQSRFSGTYSQSAILSLFSFGSLMLPFAIENKQEKRKRGMRKKRDLRKKTSKKSIPLKNWLDEEAIKVPP